MVLGPTPLRTGTNYTISKRVAKKTRAKKNPGPGMGRLPIGDQRPHKGLVRIIPKKLAHKRGVPTKLVRKKLVGKKGANIIRRARKKAAATKRTGREVFHIRGRKVVVGRGGHRVVVRGRNRTIVNVRRPGLRKTVVHTGTATKKRSDDVVRVKRRSKKGASYRKTVFNRGGRKNTVRVVHKRGSKRIRVIRSGPHRRVVRVIGPRQTKIHGHYPTKKRTNKHVVKGRGKKVSMTHKRRRRGPRFNQSLTPEQLKNIAARKLG
jgi:hypothetical protein